MDGPWTEVVPGLWRHVYRTGSGIEANSHLLRLADGTVAVFSPPAGADDGLFAATEALGGVTVLVAPNTGHDLGIVAWQARYPNARCFAPEVAGPQIQRAKSGCRELRPLAELAPLLPATARVMDVPHTTSGLTMFSVEDGDRRALFIDEVVNHDPPMPAMFRFVFWVTGSRGGVARTRLWTWIFAKDKGAVARAVLAEMDAHPPTVVLVGHGAPILAIDQVRAQLSHIA